MLHFLCNLCTFDKDKDEAAAVDAEPEEDDFADIDDSAGSLEEDLSFVMDHFDELDIEEEEAYEKAGLPSDLRLHDIAGAKNDKLKKPGAAASAASASTAAPASHSCEDPAAHARFFDLWYNNCAVGIRVLSERARAVEMHKPGERKCLSIMEAEGVVIFLNWESYDRRRAQQVKLDAKNRVIYSMTAHHPYIRLLRRPCGAP